MRKIWIGVGVLLALLGMSLWAMVALHRLHEPVLQSLELAISAPRWEQAAQLSEKAQTQWERNYGITAALADHGEMDQIDRDFAQLAVYRSQGDVVAHSAVCASLSEAIRGISEAHRLTWWNLL